MTEEQAIKIRGCFANGVPYEKIDKVETDKLVCELERALELAVDGSNSGFYLTKEAYEYLLQRKLTKGLK